jgi:MarR family transcriptional repressor of emrRAB
MSEFDVIESSLQRLAARAEVVPLDELILLRLIHHYSDAVNLFLRQTLKPHGLNEWEFRTLLMLQAAGRAGVPMTQLSQLAGETTTNMTRICNGLVKDGLAVRSSDTGDRRKILLSILPRGEAILAEVTPGIMTLLRWSMEALTVEEIAVMTKLMKRLVARMETGPEAYDRVLAERLPGSVSMPGANAARPRKSKKS